VRSGIIVSIEHIERASDGSMGYRCVMIDGDSDAISAAVGTKVLRSERVLSAAAGDRFIRWTATDGREENQEAINIAVDAASFREAA
jgi:nitroimidazol reductase NimA-like FMN-containing flavoprotein (pyridoxamine 5'-phosphate oxidase superfamily)